MQETLLVWLTQANITWLLLAIVLLPLLASLLSGLFGRFTGRRGAQWLCILAVLASGLMAGLLFWMLMIRPEQYDIHLYEWARFGELSIGVGFYLDRLSALMMCVVTSVSLMVHIYTIGYMREDPGYQRFYSYIALFTFAMLVLVLANNLMQLFFGWEAVGLVSYLLIGFWFKRPSAIHANLKAFLVNRVGDLGFLLGIAGLVWLTGTLQYTELFNTVAQGLPAMNTLPGLSTSMDGITAVALLLFVGAMAKSAQMPLHVWLPDSMEGPTPISALIHAATMVTAGIYMVARLSPVFELSATALSVILIIGATTALLMGLLGLIQTDIKRVVAYSTLSQLGYMTAALGASAYSAAIFHLMTHAFFKALLFLGAGAVIIALHHQQDMRQMGGMAKRMPVTYITMVLASLALIGFPGFAGFFSKDIIIEAVHYSHAVGHTYAYWALLLSVFVTAWYTFRMLFMVFHGKSRNEHAAHLHATGVSMKLPLVLLAIPSVVIGWLGLKPLLQDHFFARSITVLPEHDGLHHALEHFADIPHAVLHGFMNLPFALAVAGVGVAWVGHAIRPTWPQGLATLGKPVHTLLHHKYGFDAFNERVLAPMVLWLGRLFWRQGDQQTLDGKMVHGTANGLVSLGRRLRLLHTGYLYHYAFMMMVALVLMMWLRWFLGVPS